MAFLLSTPMIEANLKEYVPQLFQRYVAYPLRLCIAVPFIIAAALFFLRYEAQNQPQESSITPTFETSAPSEKVVSLSLSGEFDLTLDVLARDARILQGGLAGSSVYRDSNSLLLKDSSGIVRASLIEKEGEEGKYQEIYNSTNQLIYSTKKSDEGYKILSSDRSLLSKVKIKEDKFNIYSAEGIRTHYGKFKNGRVSIRNDGGTEVASLSSSNSPSLKQISPLCLPIGEDARILLFLSYLYSEESW